MNGYRKTARPVEGGPNVRSRIVKGPTDVPRSNPSILTDQVQQQYFHRSGRACLTPPDRASGLINVFPVLRFRLCCYDCTISAAPLLPLGNYLRTPGCLPPCLYVSGIILGHSQNGRKSTPVQAAFLRNLSPIANLVTCATLCHARTSSIKKIPLVGRLLGSHIHHVEGRSGVLDTVFLLRSYPRVFLSPWTSPTRAGSVHFKVRFSIIASRA